MLLTSGLQVSLFPPPSPTPSSPDPQIPPCVLEKGIWGCPRPFLQRWLACFDSLAHSRLVPFCTPSSTSAMTKTQQSPFPSYSCLKLSPEHKFFLRGCPHKLHLMCCSGQGEGTWGKELVSHAAITRLHICLILCHKMLGRSLTFIPTFVMGIICSPLQIRMGIP